MINKKQSGFSVPIMILVITILILTGVVGWLVWDRIQNNKVVVDNPKVGETAKNPNSTSNIPSGYTEYKNQEFGIKFVYPTGWGSVASDPDFEMKWGHVSAGKGVELTFSNEKNVKAAIRSKDWTHNLNMGHGGADNVLYFAPDKIYDSSTNSQRDTYKVYKNDQTGYFALIPLCGDDASCSSMGLVLIKSLTNNQNTNGIAFLYVSPTEINLNYANDGVQQKDIDTLPWAANFPNSLIKQFETIDNSISNL